MQKFYSMMTAPTPAVASATAATAAIAAAPTAAPTVVETVDIAPIWSGHPVGFALLTHGDRQYVAYYDDQRHMAVAERKLNEKTWRKVILPETVGWDSHNYITMTMDDAGCLHLSGNMHVNPLVYFVTTKPGDITTFVRLRHLIGTEENRVTYPTFLRGPKGMFLFTYRDGQSGNGNQIYDRYDAQTKKWSRLLDKPLTDGEGQRNAYFENPKLGPDGKFHLVWVWRETGDASTNHDPTYAQSDDMVHWTKSDGTPYALPITLETGEIVDHIPVKGGIINGNVHVGWDTHQRLVVSYHKYDANGNIQIYNARRENGVWKVYQTSDWNFRWNFGGGGSIPFEVGLGPVVAHPDGTLTQHWITVGHGTGTWLLDETTLKPKGSVTEPPAYPAEFSRVTSTFPGMQVKSAGDLGKSPTPHVRYVLRWETLGANRDQPRTGPIPAPTMLRLYELRTP